MVKRKNNSGRGKRLKDKLRKREQRQEKTLPTSDAQPDDKPPESTVPFGAVDGAVSVPPSNFLGHGSIGLPPIEGKPLARLQASLREKMQPTALSNASSQGSRLCARNGGMAPSPDSPPWVCTSARVPEPDTVHVSCSAGQAQLDMSSSKGDESSRILIDANQSKRTRSKKDTKRNLYDENENIENVYERNKSDCRFERSHTGGLDGAEYACFIDDDPVTMSQVTVQGSFHQGDLMFGENAGTQCVANCLTALAYHKIKNAKQWKTPDMNKVLTTGDELYTYLQRSSTIVSRYLLVDELPQFFECFNTMFEFKAHESLCSLINLSEIEPNYDDFNAYSILDALEIALGETSGCFMCFSGNTFLIGKTSDGYFTFDSHSRSSLGNMAFNGKSTRILYQSVYDIYNHVLSLALSLGLSGIIECEVTGVDCSVRKLSSTDERCLQNEQTEVSHELRESNQSFEESANTLNESCQSVADDDVEFVCSESQSIDFLPLSSSMKNQLCEIMGIPQSNKVDNDVCHVEEIGAPTGCIEIQRDGNCFFRAISFCLTGVEDYHYLIRSAVCQHLLHNTKLFETFVRPAERSVKNHLSLTDMSKDGSWATETEILALCHLLSTDVHTYTENHWITYSRRLIEPTTNVQSLGSIYLDHENQNHYNVVVTVAGKETDSSMKSDEFVGNEEYRKKQINRNRMRAVRITSSTKKLCKSHEMKLRNGDYMERKSRAAKLKYKTDLRFRLKALADGRNRYRNNKAYQTKVKERSLKKYTCNKEHRFKVMEYSKNFSKRKYIANDLYRLYKKKTSIEKYSSDVVHRMDVKQKSTEKYKNDGVHRMDVKRRSTEKYKNDGVHRMDVKRRSTEKYKNNDVHRMDVKQRSTEKYKNDDVHRMDVKQRSTEKYKNDDVHRMDVKQRSTEKYKNDGVHRMDVRQRSIHKYKNDELHRMDVKQRSTEKYKNNEEHKDKVKTAGKRKYNLSADEKRKKKENVLNQRRALKVKLEDEDEVVKLFKESVRSGPEYTCCCCHRLLFEHQVQGCRLEMYKERKKVNDIAQICIQKKYVHDCTLSCPMHCPKSSLWICFTCHRKILSGNTPAEAVVNRMSLEEIPSELKNLNSLEQHLIALHIPFMKVMALPQGGQRNVHGPVVCVPSNVQKATSLPRNENDNLLLRVKLKRKLAYKGHFEYQFVNPNHINMALEFLKKENRWYKDVGINTTWEENDDQNDLLSNKSTEFVDEEMKEEDRDNNQEVVTDTCLQPVDIAQEVLDHYFDDVYNIAPGEGKNPIRMLQEEGNEAKTFPHLFPSGNFSWNEHRDVKITLSRYFNNRLMNSDNRFAKDTNYIFFSQYMSELNQVIEKTQISVRKSLSKLDGGKAVTSEMLQNPDILSKLLRNDEALRFMQPIRGTPAYWSTTQKDLFAMLRQLGIPTWFCSFSAAEYRWNEIIGSILHHDNDSRLPTDLDWSEKSEILRSNPVTVARMFEHRFHMFQRHVILSPSKPIGNVTDYFVRVEFQQRGSPHMHCLYWVENAPKFDEDDEETVCDFIDRYITCALPSENDDSELRRIVLGVQQHSKNHSKSCKKKGTDCRFNFPRPPSQRTFITRQCEEEEKDTETDGKFCKSQAKDILLHVWNEVLNDENECKTTEEMFMNMGLSQDLYEKAHRLLSAKTSTILRRNPDEMWTNQYNSCLLKCWDANMDIQYILDPFSCIVYIISYISKSEREMGMLLKQTQIESAEGNLNARQTMKKIGSAYLNHREVSAQEAVYRVCNLKMKESSRKVAFVPVGENPTRLSKPLAQMKRKSNNENDVDIEDDDDSIWMTNVVERYESRPDSHPFPEMCLAEFCSEYRVLAKSQIPKGEKETVFELKNGNGYIQKRTRGKPAVIRYPRFNPENAPEKYYQSILQLFLPYVTQDQLKPPGFDLHQTFYENGFVNMKTVKKLQSVRNIVENNRSIFSKNEDAIENAQETLECYGEPEDAWANLCPETEKNREECLKEKRTIEQSENREPETTHEIELDGCSDMIYHIRENSNSRQEILPLLRSLNQKQKQIFYLVRDWCLKKVSGKKIEPLHIFVTGGAGTGKSHLIKTIQYEASRVFEKTLLTPSDLSVLLTAFTGTAAFNIGGNTIHHVFSLTKALPIPYEPLKEQTLSAMRVKLASLQILVIDEVSMVFKRLLYYIHERLVQIKKCKEPFGGISIIAVGDFFQLPPVKQRKVEILYKENAEYPIDYWLDFFKIIELDEIMRQRDDAAFASVLNSLRVRTIEEPLSEEAKIMLKECIRDGPDEVLHVYPTNEEANEYNLKMLQTSCGELIEVAAEDYQKDKTTGKLTLREKPFLRTRTDGLSTSLLLSVNAKVMLTRNINVEDGLVNGAMGHISDFDFGTTPQRNKIEGIKVVFDCEDIGRLLGKRTARGNEVLIQRIQEDIREKNTKNFVRHQFPLKLAWACTAHKVQGMTTNSVVVNLDRTFAPGQAYVAISRVTSQNGLFIETRDENALEKKIYANPDVKSALSKMEKLIPGHNDISFGAKTGKFKTIVLINVQSLRGHFPDLKSDTRILSANFICVTETWLTDNESTKYFEVPDFELNHITRKQSYDDRFAQLRTAKGGGVGVYKRRKEKALVNGLPETNIEGMAVELYEENTVIILIYRPSTLSVRFFLESLQKVVDFFKVQYSKCLVLGDFNEDAQLKGPIQRILETNGFKQKVNFATTEGDTILDHVYVTEEMDASVEIMPVYYSYHDAVIVHLRTE
ncbi:uncharacterized protein LOC134239308 [Saccostrea cucullata]|uniref:uncharacterized protein LOC134239308 n=1 Tax=Saccostrea cuccullata TaxID=36930 RepID=UPI002ED51D45